MSPGLGELTQACLRGGGWIDRPGQTWISDQDAELTWQDPSSSSVQFWRHEIGHILGLEHPHNNYGRQSSPIEYDNLSYSLMSYRIVKGRPLLSTHTEIHPTTYMPMDVFALQHLHGANYATKSDDTTYKFEPARKLVFETIWDGGGSDTLDFSDYATDGIFDIRPGKFSTPSASQLGQFGNGDLAEGSVAMSLLPHGDPRALIEDISVGNGDNVIVSNQADNVIRLGTGENRLVFFPNSGRDTVYGFDGDDCIDISNYDAPADTIHIGRGEVLIDQWPRDAIIVRSAESPSLCPESESAEVEQIVDASLMAEPEIENLKAKMSSASSLDLKAEHERLWKMGEYKAGFALANMAFEKYHAKAAAYRMGTAYKAGLGVKKDIERAFDYLSFPDLNDARYARYLRGVILADPAFSRHDTHAARVELEAALAMGVQQARDALRALDSQATPISGLKAE